MALDITSYALGKKAGGGVQPTGTINITENGITNVSSYATADVNVQPDLETKSITITENTTTTITPTSDKDGLSSVEVITNVPSSGDDWSDIGYSSTPQAITNMHTYSKQVYDAWDPNSPHKFNTTEYQNNLIICPLVDTSKMTNMREMFSGCSLMLEVPSITTSSSVTTMRAMFSNCKNLINLNMSNFNTSNVTEMREMFSNCSKLSSLNFTSFDTSKVDTMYSMFYGCTGLTSIDLSSFNTSNVTTMSGMFSGCSNLITINFGSNFNLTKITNLSGMFTNCYVLDDNTLNQILYLCTTATAYTGTKNLSTLGITNSTLTTKIPTLSNYQAFLDAGWTIS